MTRVPTIIVSAFIGLVLGTGISYSQSSDALEAFYTVEGDIARVGALETPGEIDKDRQLRAIAYLTLAMTELKFPGEYVIE